MKPRHVIITLLILLAYGALAYFVDTYLVFILACVGTFWIGLPCLALFVFFLIYDLCFQRTFHKTLTILGRILALLAATWLALIPGTIVNHRAESAAIAYPDQIRPLLEAYHTAHGTYPASLDAITDVPAMPRFLRESRGYQSDGVTYSFTFPRPSDPFDNWWYDSESHTWRLFS